MTGLADPACTPIRLDGSGEQAVVAVHGFTGCPAHWRLLAPGLAERGLTVRAPLLPGHGTRPEELEVVTVDDWVAAVVEAGREVADARRVHLVGLSLGGLLALLAAGPLAASSVTTINSPVLFRDRRAYLTPLVHRLQPWVSYEDQPRPEMDEEAAQLFFTYRAFPTVAVARLVEASARATLAAGRLRRPALVIQSRRDEAVDPRSGPILARRLGSSARLVWLESSIHNAILGDERQRVLTELLTFLDRSRLPASGSLPGP